MTDKQAEKEAKRAQRAEKVAALRRQRDLLKFTGRIGKDQINGTGELVAHVPGTIMQTAKYDLTGATVEIVGDGAAGTQVSGGRVGGGAVAGMILAGPVGAAIGAGAGALAKKSKGIINVTLTLASGDQHHYLIPGKNLEQVQKLAGVVEYLNRTA